MYLSFEHCYNCILPYTLLSFNFFLAETGPSPKNSTSVLWYFSTYGYQNPSCCTCEPMVTGGDQDRKWEGLKSIALQWRVLQISIHPNASPKGLAWFGQAHPAQNQHQRWKAEDIRRAGGKPSSWRRSPPRRGDYSSGWKLNWNENELLEALKKTWLLR